MTNGNREAPVGFQTRTHHQDERFVELTKVPPYTTVINPDAERWRELAVYDLGTAEAMLAAGRYMYVLFCCQQAMEKHLKGLIVERVRYVPAPHA